MKTIPYALNLGTGVLLAVLIPCGLMAQPIVVSINDVPNAAPVIQVRGAPNGYDIYTGDLVNDPAIEDGALITLYGVNNYYSDPDAALPDWGGRFRDSTPWQCLPPWEPFGDGVDYRQYRTAVDIVWVEHDYGDDVNGYYGQSGHNHLPCFRHRGADSPSMVAGG